MPRNNGDMERRTYDITDIEVITRDDTPDKIVGHAAVFNTIGDGGWFREQVAPGAFARSINDDDVRALFNHDKNFVLGRNKAGTLEMSEDEQGLLVSITPPDTQLARDLRVSISRGDISGMSIGFEIIKESREAGEDGELDLFTLEEVKLWDVSPVTFPFYKETDVSMRSREAWREEVNQQRQEPTRPNMMGKRLQLLKREFEARRN
jgi:uncharacterized protein